MRRLLSWLFIIAMFVLPMLTSCVPSGYEGKNPSKPDKNQVPVDQLKGDEGQKTDNSKAGGDTGGK